MSQASNLSTSTPHYQQQNQFIERALRCLENRFRYSSLKLDNSTDVSAFLRLQLAEEKNEVFAVIFLNAQLKLIAFEKLFHGTINESNIYPRRVVQKALEYNAETIIIAHNHPSGNCRPSTADEKITLQLKTALSYVDIRLADHLIVSHVDSFSFAEHNLM